MAKKKAAKEVKKHKVNKYLRTISRLREKIRKLQEEKEKLRHENKELKDIIFKTKRHRTQNNTADNKVVKKRGAPFGHEGKTRNKPKEIDETIEVEVKKCPYCHSEELTKCKRYDEHIQEDIVLPKVKVTKYRHHRYYCNNCKKISAGIGKEEIPGSYIGANAKGLANYMHYKSHMSYDKIRDLFLNLFNLAIEKSSVYGFDNQVKHKGNNIYEEIKTSLRKTNYLHVDETGWPNDGKGRWLWCMANKELIFYHINKRRSAKVVEETLGANYQGVILSDFLNTYNKLNYKKQKCLVHLLRISKRLQERFSRSFRIKTFCKKLNKLIKNIMETHKNMQMHKISKTDIVELRGDIKSRIKILLSLPLPYPAADKLRRKLKNMQHELITCLDSPYVPPHNNFVEQQIRPNVILRKITFGTRSEAGIENHQTIMSIIQTAILNNYPVLDLLKSLHLKQPISLGQLRSPP